MKNILESLLRISSFHFDKYIFKMTIQPKGNQVLFLEKCQQIQKQFNLIINVHNMNMYIIETQIFLK